MTKSILLVMARAPRFGTVKTRLARDIGVLQAWQFYRQTLKASLQRLGRSSQWNTWLQVTPDRDMRPLGQWPASAGVITQGRGGLGPRMERGLTAFPLGTPVVLIGSDIPDVTEAQVQRAFKALRQSDVVLGPAADGGFWLVGFANRRPVHHPFENVRWSTPHALNDTLNGLPHRRIALVDRMRDVDDGESYRQRAPTTSN